MIFEPSPDIGELEDPDDVPASKVTGRSACSNLVERTYASDPKLCLFSFHFRPCSIAIDFFVTSWRPLEPLPHFPSTDLNVRYMRSDVAVASYDQVNTTVCLPYRRRGF
jgi:hypothetical protein